MKFGTTKYTSAKIIIKKQFINFEHSWDWSLSNQTKFLLILGLLKVSLIVSSFENNYIYYEIAKNISEEGNIRNGNLFIILQENFVKTQHEFKPIFLYLIFKPILHLCFFVLMVKWLINQS